MALASKSGLLEQPSGNPMLADQTPLFFFEPSVMSCAIEDSLTARA